MSRQAGAFVTLTAVVSFLLGLVVAGTRPPIPTNTLPPSAATRDERPLNLATGTDGSTSDATSRGVVDFASVAARINAAVVSVETASRANDDLPARPRRYAGDEAPSPHEGSGSGFLIDASGYILTNDHVVAGADRVTVTLNDGRAFRADIVGGDPTIDVALLRVHAKTPLPVAPLGDSDALRVGQWVCAIGNPLGVYTHSVTVGVVSYLGRKLFDPGLDAYIQTDAAISLGNSGGPLVNERGEVVGITTAISVAASNIGFAVPIAQVVAVLPQLREHGTVTRGTIGVTLTDLTPTLRRALQLGPERGALVEDVDHDSDSGLRMYDVIVRVDGRAVVSDTDVLRYVSSRQPGTVATVDVWRNGAVRTIPIKLRDRPLAPAIRQRAPRVADVRPAVESEGPLGMKVRDLTNADYDRMPDTIQGVLVVDVDPVGPARLAQIRPNHVILEINRQRVTSAAQYRALVSALRPGDVVALLIYDRTLSERMICTVAADSGS